MIVADTNLLIYLYVQGERTEESEAVLRRDATWTVPLLWRSEFRNALIGLVRKEVLAVDQALSIVDETERWLAGYEYSVISRHVLTLADRSGCSAYDCEFVALAQDLGIPLVTTDRQILKAFPRLAISPDGFAR
ncbi:MAG TPA: type II toxin-antitoxin system VapC family toxin [Nitrospira sp.]|nr:type II toxin-antitoxin system VapC family toxin [Nitrospira sp.]